MLFVRTINRVRMNGLQLWLTAATLYLLVLTAGGEKHHRRSASQGGLPLSKNGWRPVVGSGSLLYGSFGTAPLHAPSYKLPVLDLYPSSARPLATRDATKLTSIAQSYRPTTLRTVSAAPASPVNQPVNSYLNPFALPNNGVSHFKYIQSYPHDGFVIRNNHNAYAPRPQQKYQTKHKQPAGNLLQQLTSIQPIHFGQYQTPKPHDFGKPIDSYGRPIDGGKRQQSITEIYKPEVYKLPDTNTAQQQEVKTAQQQTFAGVHNVNPLANYAFQDSPLPPSILGSFGSFGLQFVKGRDPQFPSTKAAYLPPQPTKQTIFNSFSYTSNNFKSTPSLFSHTTPKLQTIQNQYQFGTTVNDYRNFPTPQTKLSTPSKIDPNANTKSTFKPSPQDPFAKGHQNFDSSKITTYNPIGPTTPLPNSFYFSTQHNLPVQNYQNQQNTQIQNYLNQQNQNYFYENKKNKNHDSVAAGINQLNSQLYTEPPRTQQEKTPPSQQQGHYEVTEYHNDVISQSSPWTSSPEPYQSKPKPSDETVIKQENIDTVFRQPSTTSTPDVTEEFVIVTESEKGYENSLSYDAQVESQSRRPSEENYEPIDKSKLKEYYYKVSTPSYGDHTYARRTKKPTESSKLIQSETTTSYSVHRDNNNTPLDALPTLPPNKHFKRPSTPEPLDKDRIRKRNKIRRRRPAFANSNRNKQETTTRISEPSSSEPILTTTITEEVYTIRPRVRPGKQDQTTPSVTTDLTTSALPTISPTAPTIVRKKIGHRRQLTTPIDKPETTTVILKVPETIKESPIMKISTRPQLSKLTSSIYEYKASDVPDYSHKQDEKDTPTSDVSVSLSDSLKSSADLHKEFLFHRDVKPVEIKEVTTEISKESNEYAAEVTTTQRTEITTRTINKRLRPKNKLDRPKFNVKDYRNRLSSTTSTTEKAVEDTPKPRHPQRKAPYIENTNSDNDNATERRRFTPKEPRHKHNRTENNEQIEKEHSTRQTVRYRQATSESESTTQKISSRIRSGSRRPRPTEETTETTTPTSVNNKRLLRKRIKDSEAGESVQDISVTENYDQKNEITSERTRSESAIMKIADKKHQDHMEHLFEHSKRVSDLTLAASKDYNNPGMFKTVSGSSRRIPNYFTIATDDPILPIEAFFPQLNQKKVS